MDKPTLTNLIHKFISQRSGIEWRNYMRDGNDTAGRAALRADYSRILKHGRDARALLRAVELSSITAESITGHLTGGGRLSLEGERLEYVTGQYFPTEYRAAVCRILADMLITHYGEGSIKHARQWASRNVGRGVAARWFT